MASVWCTLLLVACLVIGTCRAQESDQQLEGAAEDPCQPNPCKHTGVCTSDDAGQFTCECSYPLGGDTCEELICKNCYQKDDLVIFVDSSLGSLTWHESRDHCESKGMTLLLDKDPETHKFVADVLSSIHTNKDARVAYWIAVNRDNKAAPFKYVDGTPVTSSYAPWAPDRPGSSNCINIANGQPFNWRWDDDDCEGYPGWSYFNLCQKRYPCFLE